VTTPVPTLPPRYPGRLLDGHFGEVPPKISYAIEVAPPNKGLQLTIDSWAFLSSVAFWRGGFCSVALTASAVCCS
jgi:hypothetical protein